MSEKSVGLSPEFEIPRSRNDIIRKALSEERIPMLPFEQHQFEIELLGHVATQSELSSLLGEAMNTTSETWHDNAQADAVAMQAQILEKQASSVIEALKMRFIVPYEQDEKDRVSIGALVNVLIGRHPETIFITGKRRSLPDEVVEIVGKDTVVINVSSPIGAAIFDQPEGAVASYRVGEREIQVAIVSIEYPEIIPAKN